MIYTVILTRDTTESAVERIEAESEEEAQEKALAMDPVDLDFAHDENIPQTPYITNCELD